ncbi:protein phosphatase 2C domain-containing protein [Besnoitia besnoiti]|uniref:Protein phosphatase 2C domain-containing protein n=1 Tax=Besnoitia besnoiti TaxID=94643 RepID=A0A2A9M6L4_BESBE|nr:protein phosphatase 2C domain-containing protein [Besnoitia besnoiti]PFH31283.1 protein phosphatase 2C domain-containing protein [Besnoitia besnoiti]
MVASCQKAAWRLGVFLAISALALVLQHSRVVASNKASDLVSWLERRRHRAAPPHGKASGGAGRGNTSGIVNGDNAKTPSAGGAAAGSASAPGGKAADSRHKKPSPNHAAGGAPAAAGRTNAANDRPREGADDARGGRHPSQDSAGARSDDRASLGGTTSDHEPGFTLVGDALAREQELAFQWKEQLHGHRHPKLIKSFAEQKAKKMVLVLDWHTKTIAATMNGRRPQDEDAMLVQAPLKNFPNARLKAIFDGHGGFQISRRCVNVAHEYIGAMPNLSQESFREASLLMDADMRTDQLKGGSTGLMVAIEKVDDPLSEDGLYFRIYAANVGDSRGLIVHQNGTFTIMSRDHRPTALAERERIRKAGGFLLRRVGVWRVEGRLALSRAFGDFALKDRDDMAASEQKVVALPDVMVFRARPGDIILMGCDGLFERPEMNWQFVADLLNEELERAKGGLAEVAYRLLESAFMLGSRDNVSVMITKLTKKSVKTAEVKRFDYNFTGERVVLPSDSLPGKPTDNRSGRYGVGSDMLVTLF